MAEPLDLCAVCLSGVWPGPVALKARQYGGYGPPLVVRRPDGAAMREGVPTVDELAAGATVDVPGGYTLPMRAVTTIDGTRVCHRHAGDALEAAGRRPMVVNR